MVFSKKWLRNHSKFLLHFLIHIFVLILCSKFEPIPTSIFQVTAILKQHPISDYCNPPGSEQKLSTCTGTLYMMLIHGHNVNMITTCPTHYVLIQFIIIVDIKHD